MNILFQTNRFTIRNIEKYDAEAMFDMDSNPKVHEFLGKKPISSLKEAEDMIQNIQWQHKQFGIGRWAIADKNTNEFIGWTGFKREEKLRPDRVYVDLGYRLREKYWGQGIATETALACLDYGFKRLNFQNIYACTDFDNTASNKVLKKIGMTYLEDFEFEGIRLHWYGIKKRI